MGDSRVAEGEDSDAILATAILRSAFNLVEDLGEDLDDSGQAFGSTPQGKTPTRDFAWVEPCFLVRLLRDRLAMSSF